MCLDNRKKNVGFHALAVKSVKAADNADAREGNMRISFAVKQRLRPAAQYVQRPIMGVDNVQNSDNHIERIPTHWNRLSKEARCFQKAFRQRQTQSGLLQHGTELKIAAGFQYIPHSQKYDMLRFIPS